MKNTDTQPNPYTLAALAFLEQTVADYKQFALHERKELILIQGDTATVTVVEGEV